MHPANGRSESDVEAWPGNADAYFLKVPPMIPFDWAMIGLGICSLVGIIFGTYPAYKAANLDPIESLRYE